MTRPLLILVLAAAACGHKIGDSCTFSADCAQDGTRVCDTYSAGGYCTIRGCDFDTCPDEAVCVRFFPGLENAAACTGPSDCASDEVCTVGAECAPVSIEQRFCMLSCESDGDCRDTYECRTTDLMKVHGGEPVPDPSSASTSVPSQAFCAPRRPCSLNTDCASTETCDFSLKVCLPK